jgi:hypothetical protein
MCEVKQFFLAIYFQRLKPVEFTFIEKLNRKEARRFFFERETAQIID